MASAAVAAASKATTRSLRRMACCCQKRRKKSSVAAAKSIGRRAAGSVTSSLRTRLPTRSASLHRTPACLPRRLIRCTACSMRRAAAYHRRASDSVRLRKITACAQHRHLWRSDIAASMRNAATLSDSATCAAPAAHFACMRAQARKAAKAKISENKIRAACAALLAASSRNRHLAAPRSARR